MMLRRRSFLTGPAAIAAAAAFPRRAEAAHTGLTIGAIRWDPWYAPTDNMFRPNVEASLGQAKWQFRAPTCAIAAAGTATTAPTINLGGCGVQSVIDAEITAAHAAGLDYWAYCWYGAADEKNNAWALHQSSSLVANMNWALIHNYGDLVAIMAGTSAALGPVSLYTGYYARSNYQKVLSGRPLVFLLDDGTITASALAATITSFRAACTSAGVANPYITMLIVGIDGVTNSATYLTQSGCDAIGSYATLVAAPLAGTYAQLVTASEAAWTALKATGAAMVPTAISGADRRPRVERPLSYEGVTSKPGVGDGLYYAVGTPSQVAAHIADMVTFMNANATANPSRTGLIYSWSEYDEGGTNLAPTIGTGSAVLTAVAGVL
jgi:hypothetical protein